MSSRQKSGQIQVIFGPMFSGKTTELLRRMRRYTVANRSCLVIKYKNDTRYSNEDMATHDRQLWSAFPTDRLFEALPLAKNAEVIGIDEGQFFPDLVDFCEKMANDGKIVVVAALDGTFQRKPFGEVLMLVPLAESVTKLNAVCMVCFKDAPFTRRLGNETKIELIGGSDMYISVCRSCFNKNSDSIDLNAIPTPGKKSNPNSPSNSPLSTSPINSPPISIKNTRNSENPRNEGEIISVDV